MKRETVLLGILSLLLAVGAAANTAPTITAASPISVNQGDPATASIIATVSDAEDSAGSLSVAAISVPSGITISSITNSNGSISALITAACDASASENDIVLQVTDSGGLTANATFQVFVRSTLPPPVPNITAATNGTGTQDQACPEQPLTLTAHSFGATSYQWYVDGSPIAGATSVTYAATGAGSYTATASNECYTSAQSFIAYVVQNPTPHSPFISFRNQDSNTTSLTICGGSQIIDSDSATGIQWYKDGVAIPGAGSQSYTATQSGTYTAQLNALGCHSQFGRNVTLTVSSAPSAPTITAGTNGTGTNDQACPEEPLTLVAHDTNSSLTNYQWYNGNDAISGSTSNQLVVTAAGDYTIVATLNGCSTSSAAYTVQNPTPHKPTITVLSDSTTICTNPGGWGVLLQSDSATGIQWYNGNFPISGANNQTLLATESGSYSVILNALGCHSEQSDPVVITVNVAPETPTITAATNGTGTQDQACPEQPLVLTANDSNPSSTSYQWHVNNETIDGATSKTYSATRSGDFTVVATSPEGCSMTSAAYTVQNPTPHSPFISFRNQDSNLTTLEICQGTSVIIDSDSATGIQWYKDGVAIPGAGSQSYVATQSGVYTAQLNALGCHSQFGRNVTLIVDALPTTPTITGDTNGTGTQDQACPEQPLTLHASSTGAASYQWYSDNAPVGDGTSTLTVTGVGNYSVTATNGACTTARSATYVVQNPTPHSPFISFRNQDSNLTTLSICEGSSVIIDSDSATGIQWYKDGVAIPGAGSQSYTATQSGVYTAQLNALGCHSQFGRNVTLTVDAMPTTPTVTGATNGTGTQDQACPEQPLTLTASSTGAVSYQWYSDNAPVGDGTSTLTVTAAGNYSVTATNGTCTTARSTTYVVQNPTPHSPFISIRNQSSSTTSIAVCQGTSVILDSDSATGIQWYKDGVAIAGAGSQSYTATQSGTFTAQLNALGCHSQFGRNITITVNPYPSTPTVTGATNGTGTQDQACPEQPLTLTATSSGATSFQWYSDDAPISGETSSTLTVTAAGNYSVTATSNGCTTSRSAAYVVQNPTPHKATLSVLNGTTTFCQGGSVTLWSDSATGIQWYRDGVAIAGANSESYVATISGSYTVILNALGCHNTASDAIVVTVNPYPATPTITGGPTTFCSGGSVTLTSSSATNNQWYLNGTAISGATSQSYTASASGSYTVAVTTNGCTSTSAATTVTVNANPSAAITAPAVAISNSAGNSASVASAGTGATYSWSISGGTITSGNGTSAITFTAGAAGTLTLSATVANGNGCSDTKSASVSVVDPVTVTSIKATSGSAAGGTSVTIRGTGFLAGATVTFDGVAATNVVVDSSTKIFCTTPAHAQGTVDVTVTNSNTASGTLTGGFTYKKK